MRIIGDLHTHTRYSHGRGTVMENVAQAMLLELEAIGITDHGPRSAPWIRASVNDLRRMRREVEEVNRRSFGIRVLSGVECNIISADGELDVPLEVRQELDLVLAGLHPGVLPHSGRDWLILTGSNWAARLGSGLRQKARAQNTRAVVEAVRRNEIDVITHPGYHLDIDTLELARACAERDTAMEINASHHEMTVEYCRLAAKEGVRFVISSDAHSPSDVGNLARGIEVAEAAGLRPEQILNSDEGRLFEWLERKRARRAAASGRAKASGWADWAEQPPLNQADRPLREPDRLKGTSTWEDWVRQEPIH